VKLILCVLVAASLLPATIAGQSGIRTERVAFAKGTSSKTIKGSIKGNEVVDYVVRAAAGQVMKVTFQTSNGGNYFNVNPPHSDAALFVGSTSGNNYEGTLPVSGNYTIRVYLMRSAARRKERANYTFSVKITGHIDAKVGGTPYHATGKLPCSVGTDPKGSAQCSFGVIRSGPGRAEVYLAPPGYDVTLHKDKLRVLRFDGNNVSSSNPKEKVVSRMDGDNWSISVDDFEYYTIPDAVINGG
jgi:hypothetical protein